MTLPGNMQKQQNRRRRGKEGVRLSGRVRHGQTEERTAKETKHPAKDNTLSGSGCCWPNRRKTDGSCFLRGTPAQALLFRSGEQWATDPPARPNLHTKHPHLHHADPASAIATRIQQNTVGRPTGTSRRSAAKSHAETSNPAEQVAQ